MRLYKRAFCPVNGIAATVIELDETACFSGKHAAVMSSIVCAGPRLLYTILCIDLLGRARGQLIGLKHVEMTF